MESGRVLEAPFYANLPVEEKEEMYKGVLFLYGFMMEKQRAC